MLPNIYLLIIECPLFAGMTREVTRALRLVNYQSICENNKRSVGPTDYYLQAIYFRDITIPLQIGLQSRSAGQMRVNIIVLSLTIDQITPMQMLRHQSGC
jgi:hypothetical protein